MKTTILSAFIVVFFLPTSGCNKTEKTSDVSSADRLTQRGSEERIAVDKPLSNKWSQKDEASRRPKRTPITAANNPTAVSGRGEPDLNDQTRPAAWVYVNGYEGRFLDQEGTPLLQWVIDTPVRSNLTFRVEVYEKLLGVPKDFRCVLQARNPDPGKELQYAFRAEDSTFEIGREYNLLKPGENFIILDTITKETVLEIPPLEPGDYMLAANVNNKQSGKKGLAVTYFSVAR